MHWNEWLQATGHAVVEEASFEASTTRTKPSKGGTVQPFGRLTTAGATISTLALAALLSDQPLHARTDGPCGGQTETVCYTPPEPTDPLCPDQSEQNHACIVYCESGNWHADACNEGQAPCSSTEGAITCHYSEIPPN
jgi:hypothetical protein